MLAPAGLARHRAGIEPRKPRAVPPRDHRHEAVLGRRLVVVGAERLRPGHPVIRRKRQHDVVGVGRIGDLLQPVYRERAVGHLDRRGEVRPVHEHRLRRPHGTRGGPAASIANRQTQRGHAVLRLDPCEDRTPLRPQGQGRLAARRRPLELDISRLQRHLAFRLADAPAQDRGDGEGTDRPAGTGSLTVSHVGSEHSHLPRVRPYDTRRKPT